MSWVAVGVTAASVGVSLYSANKAGKAADKQAALEEQAGQKRKEAAYFEANVLETNATQAVAVAQRNMMDAQRVAKLAESRATALAAASGGGATSPTALNVISNIAKEGSYNAARALYQGEETARVLRLQAFEKRQQGEFDMTQGSLSGEAARLRGSSQEAQSYANMLSAGGGLYAKYGGRGPSDTPMVQEQVAGQFSTVNPAYG